MSLSRRAFTKEFKEGAVRRIELGTAVAEVARACEVNRNVVHRWRRELREYAAKAFPGEGRSRTEESRIVELGRKGGRQAMRIVFFAAMLAACRRTAKASGIDCRLLFYSHLGQEVRLASLIPYSALGIGRRQNLNECWLSRRSSASDRHLSDKGVMWNRRG
jgi:transposase